MTKYSTGIQSQIENTKIVLSMLDVLPISIPKLAGKVDMRIRTVKSICKKLKDNDVILSNRSSVITGVSKQLSDVEIAKLYSNNLKYKTEATCKYCNRVLTKVFLKKRSDGNVYVNDLGKQWRGAKCPDCYSCNYYVGMESTQMSTRFCKKDRGGCGELLPVSRYYLCHNCQPVLPDDIDNDLIYWTEEVVEGEES